MIKSQEITNPFPGLRPFETDEYRLFFGREGQSDALIARLQRSHFLAVVGTSGSGKSSLVRAGLLPALRGGLMADAGSGWRVAIMRPGSDPIGNLANALVDKDVLLEAGGGLPPAEAEAVIEATLRRGSLGLVDAARQARLDEHEKLLVVVDQFEELFRFRAARAPSSTGDDASAFVKLLLEAAQQRELSIYVVPTMRSDFLGDCAQFQGLPEAINDGQYLIPRMTRDERRFAITGPVGVKRCKITEPLVNRLMNDVGDNPDQLPILQHALMRTWDYWATHRRDGEPIGLEHYEEIGTMSGALSKHADEAWTELDERGRVIAERLFKALTERGADNREIRRPTRLNAICEIAGATLPEATAIIDVFRGGGRSFLMPPAGRVLRPETVIDISHESLIRNWRRLQNWVRDEAESARIYRRLAEAAMDYRAGARGLLDDVTLQFVVNWRENSNPDRAWGVRYHPNFKGALDYLEESRAACDAALAEREHQRQHEIERDRRELETAQAFAGKQARAARRLRGLSVAMAIMFVVALATAAFAVKTGAAAANARDAAALARDAERTARVRSEKSLKELQSTQEELLKKTKIAEDSVAEARKANESAVIARNKAETEAARANQQTRIAAKNEKAAENNFKTAETNRELAEAALERSSLMRRSFDDLEDEKYQEALNGFNCLSKNLRSLVPGAPRLPNAISERCEQTSTNDRNEEPIFHLGWVYSKLGKTNSSLADSLDESFDPNIKSKEYYYSRAADSYSLSVAIWNPLKEADDPKLLSAYRGLAHAYHQVALKGYEPADGVKQEKGETADYFKKAEETFKLLLEIQEKRIAKFPVAVAVEHVNLARLYRDMNGKDNQAVEHFKIADGLWMKTADLVEELGIDALKEYVKKQQVKVLKELAEFYFSRKQFPDAEKTYDQIIDIQETYDLSRGRELADSYIELGTTYQALDQPEKANAAFLLANLIQGAELKYRRRDWKALCPAMIRWAPHYEKLGRYDQARQAYDNALIAGEGLDKPCLVEKVGEAEELLKRGLDSKAARTSPTIWEEEDAIYTTLINIKKLQKKENELDQIYDHRLENMTKRSGEFIGQYAGNWDKPRFVSVYVEAAGDLAGFYKELNKKPQAAAAYRLAFNAFPAVSRLTDHDLMADYGRMLTAYQALLLELKKPDEAARVEEAVKAIQARQVLGVSAKTIAKMVEEAVKAIQARQEQIKPPEQTPQDQPPAETTPTPRPR